MNLPRRALLRRLGAAALPAGLLSACSTLDPPQSAALRRQRPADLPARARLDRAPFVAQDDELCGPATLAMLLQAAGLSGDLTTLTREVYLPGRHGSLQAEMLAGARRHGAVVHRLSPELLAALREVAAGTPVLLLLNLALPWWPRWHYAVLIGYDLERHEALLHTGQQPGARWSLNTLEHTWARSGQWAMLALPPAQLPQRTDTAELVQALLAFEQVQGPGATLPGWSAALQRHPEVLALQLGRGNALLALQQRAEAALQFEQAARQHDSAAAWNNLAITRAQLGQNAAARQALTLALQRARTAEPIWLSAVEQTRQELQLGD